MGIRVKACYLEKARVVHEVQTHSATDELEEKLFGERIHYTWSHVIYLMLCRFLTSKVLQELFYSVTSV